MPSLPIKIDGMKELLSKLGPTMAKKVSRQAVRELYQTGILIESEAKRLCPVDDNHLRPSITTQLPMPYERYVYVEVGTDVGYAPFVEFGTGKRGAQGQTIGYPIFDSAREFMAQIGYFYGAGKVRPGTEGMAARPFLFPAFEKYKDTVGQRILTGVVKAMVKGGGVAEGG
jgi:hypothetical protein